MADPEEKRFTETYKVELEQLEGLLLSGKSRQEITAILADKYLGLATKYANTHLSKRTFLGKNLPARPMTSEAMMFARLAAEFRKLDQE